jgi:hypothetical protein
MKDFVFDIFSNNYDSVRLDQVRNSKNGLVSDTNGEILNGSIDIEKDFSIIHLNINSKSIGLFNLLASLGTTGKGGRNPMVTSEIVKRILTHPLVISFYEQRMNGSATNKSTYEDVLEYNGVEMIKDEYFKTLPHLYKELKKLTILYNNKESTDEEREVDEKDIAKLKEQLRKRVKELRTLDGLKLNKSENLSRNKTNPAYKATLELAMYYDLIADELTSIALNNRQDSGIPKSKASIELAIERHTESFNEVVSVNAKKIYYEGINQPYLKAYKKINSFISSYLFTERPEVKDAINQIKKKIRLRGEKGEMLLSNIQSYAIAYALFKTSDPQTGKLLEDEVEDLIKGDNSVAKKIKELKESNPEYFKELNKYFKEFMPVLDEYIERRKSKRGYDYVKVQPRSRSSQELDLLSEYAVDFARSNYDTYYEIENMLEKLAIIQFAFVKKRISFASLLEGSSFQENLMDRMNEYLSKSETINWEGFEDFVFKNNWFNNELVPRIAKKYKTSRGYRSKINKDTQELSVISYEKAIRGFNGPPPYVSVSLSKVEGNTAKKLIKEGKSVPSDIVLYAYVDTEIKVVNGKSQKYYIYKPTTKLGDTHLFETKDSVLAENSLEKLEEIVGNTIVNSAVKTIKLSKTTDNGTNINAEFKLIDFTSLKGLLSDILKEGHGYRFKGVEIPSGVYGINKPGFETVLVKVDKSLEYEDLSESQKVKLAEIYEYASVEELENEADLMYETPEKKRKDKFKGRVGLLNYVNGEKSNNRRFFQKITLLNSEQVSEDLKSDDFLKNPQFTTGVKMDAVNSEELYNKGRTTVFKSTNLKNKYYFITMQAKMKGKVIKFGVNAKITDSKMFDLSNQNDVVELLSEFEVSIESKEGFTKVNGLYYNITDENLKKQIESANGFVYSYTFSKINTPLQPALMSVSQLKGLEHQVEKYLRGDENTDLTLPEEDYIDQLIEFC